MSRLIRDSDIHLNYRRWEIGIPWLSKASIYNDLSFPHEKTADVLEIYENVGNQFLPQKMYLETKKTIKAYEMLKTAKFVEDFFEAYTQIGNDMIAIQCIESVIDEHPCFKWLWKSYLEFLKDRFPRVSIKNVF
uniref:Uncharacterized protein n=1 Tax=Panagrolaimus davidi TaxID=227884 RepID=A0A914QGD1_9BILA